jgi:hypothetical protein
VATGGAGAAADGMCGGAGGGSVSHRDSSPAASGSSNVLICSYDPFAGALCFSETYQQVGPSVHGDFAGPKQGPWK